MADEAVLIFETARPIPFIVSDSVAITKGALLELTDPMTAATASSDDGVVAGIAAESKVASDGRIQLAVYTEGIFRVLSGGTIALGDLCKLNASTKANEVIALVATAGAAEEVIGRCLETVSDTNTFLMELKPGKEEWPA